jgi:YD repeat-containing protein
MIHKSISRLAGLVVVGFILTTCSDRQSLVPATPLRFRLKATTDSVSGSRTEYVYDSQNRLLSFTREDNSKASFLQDEQNRYQQFDYIPGSLIPGSPPRRTKFIYKQNKPDFTTETYILQNGVETFTFLRNYTFDSTNHLIQIRQTDRDGALFRNYKYEYVGDNITTEQVGPYGRFSVSYFYTYDDKPNPYYGLIAPNSILTTNSPTSNEDYRWGTRQFSRNNVVKTNYVTETYRSEYKYNDQGLPVEETDFAFRGNVVAKVAFMYESY